MTVDEDRAQEGQAPRSGTASQTPIDEQVKNILEENGYGPNSTAAQHDTESARVAALMLSVLANCDATGKDTVAPREEVASVRDSAPRPRKDMGVLETNTRVAFKDVPNLRWILSRISQHNRNDGTYIITAENDGAMLQQKVCREDLICMPKYDLILFRPSARVLAVFPGSNFLYPGYIKRLLNDRNSFVRRWSVIFDIRVDGKPSLEGSVLGSNIILIPSANS